METILVLKQAVELIDDKKPARTGALIGSQSMLLTHFLHENRDNPLVKQAIEEVDAAIKKEKDKQTKQFSEKLAQLKEISNGLRTDGGMGYVG